MFASHLPQEMPGGQLEDGQAHLLARVLAGAYPAARVGCRARAWLTVAWKRRSHGALPTTVTELVAMPPRRAPAAGFRRLPVAPAAGCSRKASRDLRGWPAGWRGRA